MDIVFFFLNLLHHLSCLSAAVPFDRVFCESSFGVVLLFIVRLY
jgi:hypothetical protein